jgi:hypothetical protein
MKAAAAALIFGFGFTPMAAMAADPAPPAILSPAPGAVVTSPVTVTLTAGGGTVGTMPDMPGMTHGGHLHLIVDAKLPAAGAPIPMDAHHIHLMHGETTKTLRLAPGKHTIQLIAGSAGHTVLRSAPHSEPVTFVVK